MNSLEAMRLFVRSVEEIDPNWCAKEQSQSVQVLEDTAAVESASKELTKLLLEKDMPSLPKVMNPIVTNGKHDQVEDLSFSEKVDFNQSETPRMPEMERPVAEGIDAITTYLEWVPVIVTGRKPLARYQHAAAVVEGKLYVIGGNHNGRYLNDVQVLDLKKLSWSKVDTKVPESPLSSHRDLQPWFPQCAGHRLIRWGELLLVVGGHAKPGADTVTVHAFDTHSLSWTKLEVYGQAPVSRGGHSVTLIGSQLYMFGGEDPKRRLLNDLNILDLETMTWEAVTASGACPSPRADHVATAYRDKCIFVFGGGSHSDCYNDLHALDLETMEWASVPTKGISPRPRAGHAGATHGDNWFIVGGGDNTGAISETLVLDMITQSWSIQGVIQGNSAVASEGLSVEVSGNALLAFGGYNGYFNHEVHAYVLESPQSQETGNRMLPADAGVEIKQNTTSLGDRDSSSDSGEIVEPSALDEESDATTMEANSVVEEDSPATSRRGTPRNDEFEQHFQMTSGSRNDGLEQLRMAARAAQAEVEKLKVENAAALSSLADVEQELLSVRSQLQGEQSRSFRLEVEIAELKQKLSSMDALQKELDLLQRQIPTSHKVASEAAQKESKSGVWGWLAGAPPAPRYD
nr:acyl-CoA-binding domain-containing protein 6-like isoform X2 [Physcomitrium patens]|eukprot:XP_024395318.1 acyl-CoA-binding domain-containing protein 6-like isoform X2 [Physcomitrella patens]